MNIPETRSAFGMVEIARVVVKIRGFKGGAAFLWDGICMRFRRIFQCKSTIWKDGVKWLLRSSYHRGITCSQKLIIPSIRLADLLVTRPVSALTLLGAIVGGFAPGAGLVLTGAAR